jgi:hypothetical protein
MVFDARSLAIWANDIMAALVGAPAAAEGAAAAADAAAGLVDWTTRVPPGVALPPFLPAAATVMIPALSPGAEAAAAPPPMGDVVARLPPLTLVALQSRARARGLRLNGPLFAAFAAATLDVARAGALSAAAAAPSPPSAADAAATRPAPAAVCSLCAVDLRAKLAPPLPASFMSNAAGVVPLCAQFGRGADLWAVSEAVQRSVETAVSGGEGFRMRGIIARGAWAEMAPLFAIPVLWSNVGRVVEAENCADVDAVSFHIGGANHSAIMSGHVVEAGGALALTVSYSPLYHARATAEALAAAFLGYAEALAGEGPYPVLG